jgi:ribose 5-phosphate isomerase B
MKLAIGSDHVGFELKAHLIQYLTQKGHTVIDYGPESDAKTDYPIYGRRVADSIVKGECQQGILICGTGVGISIAANKVKGIRAVVCSEPYSAKLSKMHNNANIVAFGARVIGPAMAEMIVDEFLAAKYEGGRHDKRVQMLTDIENGISSWE